MNTAKSAGGPPMRAAEVQARIDGRDAVKEAMRRFPELANMSEHGGTAYLILKLLERIEALERLPSSS